MAKKTVNFNKSGVSKLPDDKPVVYKIKTSGGHTNYVGIASRGCVQERLQDHLAGGKDYIPGSKVEIERMNSISEASKKETTIISKTKPKYNKRGK
jgi:excinuclease UvrABC nuclease subunit